MPTPKKTKKSGAIGSKQSKKTQKLIDDFSCYDLQHSKSCDMALKLLKTKLTNFSDLLNGELIIQYKNLERAERHIEKLTSLKRSITKNEYYPKALILSIESDITSTVYECFKNISISNSKLAKNLSSAMGSCTCLNDLIRSMLPDNKKCIYQRIPRKHYLTKTIQNITLLLNFCFKLGSRMKVLTRLLSETNCKPILDYKKFIKVCELPCRMLFEIYVNQI